MRTWSTSIAILKGIVQLLGFCLILYLSGCGSSPDDAVVEKDWTEKALGVSVMPFPDPQGPDGFEELVVDAAEFEFELSEQPFAGPRPQPFYEPRHRVTTSADGSTYEAYCGHYDPAEVTPNPEVAAMAQRQRHRYGGATFFPRDIFIGRRKGGKLEPELVFPDVGSHDTAPHYFANDNRGACHLIVADVDSYQNNRLHLYWCVGNLQKGKWTEAWMIDKRGRTMQSHPWCGSAGKNVQAVWNWWYSPNGVVDKASGLFHVERTPDGFGRKLRIQQGEITDWAAALDPDSGELLVAFSQKQGVYVMSRSKIGKWTGPSRLHRDLRSNLNVSVEPLKLHTFVIRTGPDKGDCREWVLVSKLREQDE
jgi:hypothetical protein